MVVLERALALLCAPPLKEPGHPCECGVAAKAD